MVVPQFGIQALALALRPHLRISAMVAGVTDRLWSIADLAAMVEEAAPKPAKRGAYKKRAARQRQII